MGNFVPLYQQIAQRLLRKIQQGVYKYGDKIPSEKELAAHYGVNRMTIRRAVALLAERGTLKSMQGKGIFVTDTFYEARLPEDGAMFSEVFFRDPRLHQEILFLQQTQAGSTLSEMFRVEQGAALWLVGRRWLAENMAIALEYSYVPVENLPDFSAELCDIPWETLFARRSLPPGRLEQTVQGIRVGGEEAGLLQLQEDAGAFLVNQMVWTETHRLLRMTKILAQSEKITHYLKG
ncbi:MAG: GntR family transcriptional regulator [Oscillospiraceae bacterium]|nr:GntR family transcriptional regulator [Oscillospiraceae bacterium]